MRLCVWGGFCWAPQASLYSVLLRTSPVVSLAVPTHSVCPGSHSEPKPASASASAPSLLLKASQGSTHPASSGLHPVWALRALPGKCTVPHSATLSSSIPALSPPPCLLRLAALWVKEPLRGSRLSPTLFYLGVATAAERSSSCYLSSPA